MKEYCLHNRISLTSESVFATESISLHKKTAKVKPVASWQHLAKVGEVPEGTGTELVVEGKLIALFHANGEYHALDGVCPHAGGPLGKGSLAGDIVTCPWHGWQFDVTSGQHCLNPNLKHRSFPLKVENGEILIDIS